MTFTKELLESGRLGFYNGDMVCFATMLVPAMEDKGHIFETVEFNIPDHVTSMSQAYAFSGRPTKAYCGNNVETMFCAYMSCPNLMGDAVCGPKVKNMFHAYQNCAGITNAAVGPSIIDFDMAFMDTSVETALIPPTFGAPKFSMADAYVHCPIKNIISYSPNLTDFETCKSALSTAYCGIDYSGLTAANFRYEPWLG